jgi:hypothetical protein
MTKQNNKIPIYKRVSKSGKRYDSSKKGWTRYTVHIEQTTLTAFKTVCEAQGLSYSEGISEAVRYWISRV